MISLRGFCQWKMNLYTFETQQKNLIILQNQCKKEIIHQIKAVMRCIIHLK
ncbi:unnamed protein product [Paramecium sonneborni]|uniref:Uncharacterized protein n=1 Tax=Paramecium sonneborni TaxID=65129 RepID=A0A8S1RAX1_9CILI|nr:unnamed protein product [Paramecium sonneborni]CAD8125029.1 unnamed protein product [Paramecium sonneborni]